MSVCTDKGGRWFDICEVIRGCADFCLRHCPVATICDCQERTFCYVGISGAGPWHHGEGWTSTQKSALSVLGCCAPCTSILSKGSWHVSDLWLMMSWEADARTPDPEVEVKVARGWGKPMITCRRHHVIALPHELWVELTSTSIILNMQIMQQMTTTLTLAQHVLDLATFMGK